MANFLKSLFVKGIEIDPAGATSAQVLSYNGTKFVPTTSGVGALGLDDLSDVVITTPATTQFVRYNGTNWVNATISAGDVPTLNQNTTGSAATWTTARTITLGGDLTGNVSIDGSANATLTATIAADSIALGTDTTGNYMSGVTAGTGISVTHTPAEGSSATIAVDTAYSGFAPIGAVTMYSGSTAPTNWAICNGSELPIATYGPLYAIIGTRYGALTNGSGGVGTTHFKLPAFTSRVPKGTVSTPTVPTTTTASASSAVDVHTHGVNSTLTAGSVNSTLTAGSVNSSFTAGNATAHAHGVSINTGNESAYHYHFWSAAGVNTGNESVGHSHSYYKANSGANNNTGGVNASHYHAWSLYNQGNTRQTDINNAADALHTHLVSGNAAANTTTTVNSSFTAGNVNSTLTAGNVNSTLTAGNATTINASTPAHTHTVDSVDIVFIIRVA
jgi:microcystin-dependent protein